MCNLKQSLKKPAASALVHVGGFSVTNQPTRETSNYPGITVLDGSPSDPRREGPT